MGGSAGWWQGVGEFVLVTGAEGGSLSSVHQCCRCPDKKEKSKREECEESDMTQNLFLGTKLNSAELLGQALWLVPVYLGVRAIGSKF